MIVTAASVTVAAIYYIFTLRINMRTQQLALKAQEQNLETRQAQLFQSVYSKFSAREVLQDFNAITLWSWRDYDDFMEKYGPNHPEHYVGFWELANFYEGIGVYLKRGLLDAGMIDDFLSGPIRIFWEKLRPIILEHRKRENWPTYGEWIEYLYNEIQPIALRQHPEIETKTK